MLAFGPRLWRQMVFNTPQTLLNFVEALDTDKARHIRIIELRPSVFPETSSVIMRDSQNSTLVSLLTGVSANLVDLTMIESGNTTSAMVPVIYPYQFPCLRGLVLATTHSALSDRVCTFIKRHPSLNQIKLFPTPSSSPATEQLAPGNDWRPDGLEIVCPLSWLPTFQRAPVQKLRLEMPPLAQNLPIRRDLIPLHLVSLCLTGEWASMLTFLDCIAVFPPEEIIIYVNEDSTVSTATSFA
ncbi:hypothetical protein R3P38DRAFT_3168542 [Favolaschia claudopus]|uniref:Glycosyltransferase family 92 protein n=1 Tax=Favolaschia claudopus TaxID=2862362 RepID=A0AAW0DX24_9AGAR